MFINNYTIKKEEQNYTVTVSYDNGRHLYVGPAYEEIEEVENGVITKLKIPEKPIEAGSVIVLGDYKFKANYITKIDNGASLFYNISICKKLSKTSSFLMPFLGFNRQHFNWDKTFINSFLYKDEDKEPFIYLFYRFDKSEKGIKFETDNLLKNPNYVSCTEVDDFTTLYKFNIPKDFEKDTSILLKGKYSLISEEAKKRILKFHDVTENSILGMILYKHESRRLALEKELEVEIPKGSELCDPFYENQETFYGEQYRIKD
jgi:hypothetical protein